MSNYKQRLLKLARKGHQKIARIKSLIPSDEPLMIMPYRGFANTTQIFLKGRVLEDENIFVDKTDSQIRNLINNFKRFESDEAPGVDVEVHFMGEVFRTTTDEEGYFEIEAKLSTPLSAGKTQWLPAEVILPGLSDTTEDDIRSQAHIMLPDQHARFGVVTDMDDTILQTHVTSLFRLKMLHATLFKNVHQRLPMENIVELVNELVTGTNGESDHPVFYVSSSPWNIYDLLRDFTTMNGLPKGPILLRDFGLPPLNLPSNHKGHKIESISRILRMYPEMKFIMLGDTASRDADIYIELASSFEDQIKTIYIRHTKDTANARRIEQLFKNMLHTDVNMVKSTAEIRADALKKGYIKAS